MFVRKDVGFGLFQSINRTLRTGIHENHQEMKLNQLRKNIESLAPITGPLV